MALTGFFREVISAALHGVDFLDPARTPPVGVPLLHQKISGVLEHSYRERFAQHSFLSGRVENRSDAQPDKLW
jgi:hypothetical protein